MSGCDCYARMEGECICGAWTDSRKRREDEVRATAYATGFKAGQEAMRERAAKAAESNDPAWVSDIIRALPVEPDGGVQ